MKYDKLSIWTTAYAYRSKIAYFLISIIPLAVLTYLVDVYIFPSFSIESQRYLVYSLSALVYFLLFLSMLGYVILHRDASSVIKTVQDHNKQVTKLIQISQSLSSTIQLDILLDDILEGAVELLDAEAGSLLLYEENSEQLVFKAIRGEISDKLRTLRLKVGQGIAGWVALNRKPAIVNDVGVDSRFDNNIDQITGFQTSSILSVPLIFKVKLLGVLEIINKKGKPVFDLDDQKILQSLASEAAIALNNASYYEAQQNFFIHITEVLIKAMENNEVWKDHLRNVAKYSDLMAKRLNLPEQERRDLHFAALLHDIGMISLGPTSQLDETKKRKHPEVGANMIKPIAIWKNLYPMILYHHERWDSTGYPQGLSGHNIPLGARIISLAEAYDTMFNPYSYNCREDLQEVKEEIKRCSGSQFDPELVKLFLELLEEEEETTIKRKKTHKEIH